MRGKVGTSVISKNAHGLYSKHLVNTTRSTLPQNNLVRIRFSAMAGQWRYFTNTQQSAWNTAALTYTFYNNLGVAYVPTGYQLFIYANMNIWPYSTSFISVPSNFVTQQVPALTYGSFSIGSSTFNLTNIVPNTAGVIVSLYCSIMLPASAVGGSYKVKISDQFLQSHAVPYNEFSKIVASLGTTPIAGYKFFLTAYSINLTSGICSNPAFSMQTINS